MKKPIEQSYLETARRYAEGSAGDCGAYEVNEVNEERSDPVLQAGDPFSESFSGRTGRVLSITAGQDPGQDSILVRFDGDGSEPTYFRAAFQFLGGGWLVPGEPNDEQLAEQKALYEKNGHIAKHIGGK